MFWYHTQLFSKCSGLFSSVSHGMKTYLCWLVLWEGAFMCHIETGLTTATHWVSVSKSHPAQTALFSAVFLCVCVGMQAPVVQRLLQADGWGKTSLLLYTVLSAQTAAGSWHSLTDWVSPLLPPEGAWPYTSAAYRPWVVCMCVCECVWSLTVERSPGISTCWVSKTESTHILYTHTQTHAHSVIHCGAALSSDRKWWDVVEAKKVHQPFFDSVYWNALHQTKLLTYAKLKS